MVLPLDFVVELIMPEKIIVVISRLKVGMCDLTSNALTNNCVDTLSHATVPEDHVTILTPGHEHVTVWPRGDTHHVPHVAP